MQDAQTVASWGIDFVKADNCNTPKDVPEFEMFSNFSAALNATGRPILFSLCEWGDEDVLKWGRGVGQMMRIQRDHLPFWSLPGTGTGNGFGQGVSDIIEYVGTLKLSARGSQAFGHYDPDFLETLFFPTMDFTSSRTEFTFWSLWSSPLIVATDVRNMNAQMASLITNVEVIAIDQDALIMSGDRVAVFPGGGQLWYKDLFNGDKALVLYNNNTQASTNVVVGDWSAVGWPVDAHVELRDLWARADLGASR